MTESLPPDRGDVATERPHAHDTPIDRMDAGEMVRFLIDDQARAVEAVRAASAALLRLVDHAVAALEAGGRLVYIGAGTSGRLGVLDASECPPTFRSDPSQVVGIIAGGDSALRRSSEGREDDPRGPLEAFEELDVGAGDLVIGLTAGGTTPWVLGGLADAGRRGAVTGLVCCARPGTPVECDQVVHLATGPEALTGSTRLVAGTATKIALNTLTTAVFTRLGKVRGGRMIDLRATNDKLRDRCLRILLEFFPDLDRSEADVALRDADGSLRRVVEKYERDRATGR